MIDPISITILKKVGGEAGAELKRQGSAGIAYRRQCPKCRRWIARNCLLENGCFLCGWKSKGSEAHGGR